MNAVAAKGNDFLARLAIQGRVIGALLMREILTRYGRSNIGFMWVFVEPMLFTIGVLVLWSIFHKHSVRLPLIPFTVTGYSSVLCWRTTISRCGNAIEPNRALMHHRNVRIFDLYAARIIIELAGVTISFLTLFTALTLLQLMPEPDDILEMLCAWLLLGWFSAGMALIVGSLAVYTEAVERVWHVIAYLFLPMSGAFFMVDWLPYRFQEYALLIPTVGCTELLREGYFGPSVRAHYHLGFLVISNLVLTFAGLALVRNVSEKVEGQ